MRQKLWGREIKTMRGAEWSATHVLALAAGNGEWGYDLVAYLEGRI